MNFILHKKFSLVSILSVSFLYFPLPLHASLTPSSPLIQSSSDEVFFCENIIKIWSQQLDTLKALLQKLIDQINSKYITVNDEKAVRTWINAYINFIREMQKNPPTPEQHAVLLMLNVNEQLIEHIHGALTTSFKKLEYIDISTLRTIRAVPTPDVIIHTASVISSRLVHLENTITNAGLTRLNKTVRKLENFIDNHPHACSFFKKSLLVGSSLYGGYMLYNYFFDPTERTIPLHDHDGSPQLDAHHQPITHRTSNRAETISSFRQYFGPSMLMLALSEASRSQVSRLVDYIGQTAYFYGNKSFKITKNTLSSFHHFLRGDVMHYAPITYDVIEDINLYDQRLIGLENQIEKINVVVKYCEDPELYIRTKNEIEKGIIFIGPSRSGKTLLARALAGTINQFYSSKNQGTRITFWDLNYLELTRNKLKTIIHEAKRLAPCIIFIDEIHNLNLQTGSTQLTEFLTEMEELYAASDPRKPVFIIAATNRPELLDQAMLSHRRFGNIIRFEKPGFNERKKFFEVMCAQSAIDSEALNIESLTYQTTGCSYGDLQQIIDDARFAARNQGKEVSQKELQEATNKIAHGFINKNTVTPEERRIIIAHQAGAAAVHFLLNCSDRFELVTCSPMARKIIEINEWRDGKKGNPNDQKLHKPRQGALITYNPHETLQSTTPEDTIKECKRYLAGAQAQKILLGYSTSYRKKDRQRAFDKALTLLLNGVVLEKLSPTRQHELKDMAEKMLQQYEHEVYHLLLEHYDMLKNIAGALDAQVTLYLQDMQALHAHKH